MKCLSLQQPWATLVAIGAKSIETRSWSTPYRGPLAIQAAKTWNAELIAVAGADPFATLLRAAGFCQTAIYRPPPRGVIVAVCRMLGCVRVPIPHFVHGDSCIAAGRTIPPEEPERSFGNYSPGRYAWILADVVALREPIQCRGSLGLPDLSLSLPAETVAQLEALLPEGGDHVDH